MALPDIPPNDRTICDNCDRHKECYDEGRLFAWFTTADPYLAQSYHYKGAHGSLRIGDICPKSKTTVEKNQS